MESILPWSTSAMIIMPFLATSDFTAFVTSSNDLLEDTVTRSPLNESGAAATKDRRPGRGSGRCAPAGGRPGDLHRWRNASPVVSDPNDRGGRRFWRTYAGCVSMGPVVRRSGNRRPESRSTARLGRSEQASTASPPLCGRVHLPPRPHTAHRESNATQSESVGEFLVAPTLESCLSHPRTVPRRRDSNPLRRSGRIDPPRCHLHPDRCPALRSPDRSDDSEVLRGTSGPGWTRGKYATVAGACP